MMWQSLMYFCSTSFESTASTSPASWRNSTAPGIQLGPARREVMVRAEVAGLVCGRAGPLGGERALGKRLETRVGQSPLRTLRTCGVAAERAGVVIGGVVDARSRGGGLDAIGHGQPLGGRGPFGLVSPLFGSPAAAVA